MIPVGAGTLVLEGSELGQWCCSAGSGSFLLSSVHALRHIYDTSGSWYTAGGLWIAFSVVSYVSFPIQCFKL